MECPRCRLVNPDTARRCDCGYDFKTQTLSMVSSEPPKTSPFAIASAIFALISSVSVVVSSSVLWYVVQSEEESRLLDSFGSVCLVGFLVGGFLAFLFGLLSLVCVAGSRGTLKGVNLSLFGIFAPFVALILASPPGLFRSRMDANEAAAAGLLKTIATQQDIFREKCHVDQDGDGTGEYGYLCELSGEIVPRNSSATAPLSPRYISEEFATHGPARNGIAQRNGYCFRLYLAGKNGQPTDGSGCDGTATKPSTLLDPATDQAAIDYQESHFVIYAWPIEVNSTGRRAFVITEIGEVYGTKMTSKTYSGSNGPPMNAAFDAKGDRSDGWFNDKIGLVGNDGNEWVPSG